MEDDRLANKLDSFYESLLQEVANNENVEVADGAPARPRIAFVDKLRLFDSGVRWIMVKSKVDPEEDTDEFAESRKKLISGARGRRPVTSQSGRSN